MDLFELDVFLDAISKYLKLNQPFTILKEKKGLTWEPAYAVEINRDLESIQIFSDYMVENVGILDYRALPEEYFYKIRALVSLLDRFIKDRKRKYAGLSVELFTECEHKILALRLGGKIDYREVPNMDRDLYSFIKINQLDHKFFALGIQINSDFALPFEVEPNVYKNILWSEIDRKKLVDSSGRSFGYRFFYKEQFLVQTDMNFLLTEEFSVLYRGLTFYHPKKALHIASIDKRHSKDAKERNWVEVITLNKRGALFLLLKKADGNIFCIGVDKKKLSAPVDAYFGAYKCKYLIGVTKEEFSSIFEKFEKDKYYKRSTNEKGLLSVLQENLHLPSMPETMLTSKNKILAYLMLPYGVIKFFCTRRKYPCYGWKDVFLRPYIVSSMNRKKVSKWLEEASNSRSGEERCFE